MTCAFPEYQKIGCTRCPGMEDCAGELDDGRPFYVYVAGCLSGMPGEYLANVHRLCARAHELGKMGFCVINPAADIIEGLTCGDAQDVEAYQLRSLNLLRLLQGARAAVFIDSTHRADGSISGGVARERREALELGIPVVTTTRELCDLRGGDR